MKGIHTVIIGSLSILFVISCISGKSDYRPPTILNQPIKTSVIINKPKDEVWKTLIRNIGTSFFVINNMDKESGFLNLSYSGGNLCDYIECGTIITEVKNARGHRVHQFEGCVDYKKYEIVDKGNLLFIDRSMKLEGRINIVVQEIESNNTRVNVNIKYIVTKSADIYNANNFRIDSGSDTANFDSNDMGRFPKSNSSCRATGLLEKKILDMVQN